MKKSSREALDAYYAEAGSWAKDRADALRASRRTAWWVAGAASVIAVCEALALLFLTPLKTVELTSGGEAQAQSERSDVTAVPAMGVIAEALVAIVLADAMLEKFGGDSLGEMRRNFDGYVAALGHRWRELRDPPPGD